MVLHLIRPESGPWDDEIAAQQTRRGDQVVVVRWRDGTDDRVACEVISESGVGRATATTTLTYDDLLNLLFEAGQVYCW